MPSAGRFQAPPAGDDADLPCAPRGDLCVVGCPGAADAGTRSPWYMFILEHVHPGTCSSCMALTIRIRSGGMVVERTVVAVACYTQPRVSLSVSCFSSFRYSICAACRTCSMLTGPPCSAARNAALSAMFQMEPPVTSRFASLL